MKANDLESRIINWARAQNDIQALVLGGSRATNVEHDQWSDWDFHVISQTPDRYFGTSWISEIAPVWSAHAERTPRGVVKVTCVFEDGLEVDFVPLSAWQMKLVFWAMRRPQLAKYFPARLQLGVRETQKFLSMSGYRLLVGDNDWEWRLAAAETRWPHQEMSGMEFEMHANAFWQKAVWVLKKIARQETRSATNALISLTFKHLYPLLEEEARIAGKKSRPEGRKAELWLSQQRLLETDWELGTNQSSLAKALESSIYTFSDVSRCLVDMRKHKLTDFSPIRVWLLKEIRRLNPPPEK